MMTTDENPEPPYLPRTKVRLVNRFVGQDESSGIMIDLEPGMEGIVHEQGNGNTMVEFANYTQVFEIPDAMLLFLDNSGAKPPHAYWPQNEGRQSPQAKLKEMLLTQIPVASEVAGRERAGDFYFVEDVNESKKAYAELTALAQSLSAARQSSTDAVASLIRESIKQFSLTHHKEIRRDLNGLLGDVISPTIQVSTENVISQVESMLSRIVTGSASLPAYPNEA
jgi:hypothetical protein